MAKFVGESVEVAGSGLGIPADLIGGVEVLELELDSSDVPMDEENPLDKDLPQAGEKTMNNVEEKSHLSLCQEARAFAQDNNLVDAIATMEKAISIAPKSTQRGWKKELEKWRNELDAAAIETDTQSGAAALDVDEVQSTPNTLIAVSPRVRAVMEGFGLAQIFTIPNDAPTDEVVEILFKLMFERLQVALKAKKERSDEERKALRLE